MRKSIDQTTFDLSVKIRTRRTRRQLRDPKEIIAEMVALDAESAGILKSIETML